ncbi:MULTISPECIES: DMT family transporter [unclassified Pseudomonas]|uniref:DMT family transporter n=1 Tax=unclassified Pseudomonas TaxID=196821 RepID=UPI0024481B7E|nr:MULTISPECIES: DMT family transporter [unclassified Pseudomonas]MDG9928660.1 DMT family transporter [Pseudomonas sp. GD04042]MDH0481729.1 DMT family transporter [Pseudomonas sp. GD04015]MDH0603101.1 DMT family transporter [Pseudomonas sp. GD03869]
MLRVASLTALAMLAFAGNSLLCRAALRDSALDPASFTAIRLLSGALVLALLVALRRQGPIRGDWRSALALFGYAAGFSFAYVELDAGSGALILFGAVQASMIGYGWLKGERLGPVQVVGLVCALGGLLFLLLPGASAPPPQAAGMMVLAGVAWAFYSLLGRGNADPLAATAGNFLRSLVALPPLAALYLGQLEWNGLGALYAVLSGALASGIGYAIWYAALPHLKAIQAASVQLSVPIIAAALGALLLGEALGPRLVIASVAVLGGIGLILLARNKQSR